MRYRASTELSSEIATSKRCSAKFSRDRRFLAQPIQLLRQILDTLVAFCAHRSHLRRFEALMNSAKSGVMRVSHDPRSSMFA